MAGSRMDKLSTIFKRYTGLIKSGAVVEDSRPVWYDVYQQFPPAVEPLAIRPEPQDTIKSIYYPEDILRSRVNRTFGDSCATFNFVSSGGSAPNDTYDLFIRKYFQLAAGAAKSSGSNIDLNDETLFRQTEQALRDEYGIALRRTDRAPKSGSQSR